MNELQTIDFHGDEIVACEEDGKIFVSVRS